MDPMDRLVDPAFARLAALFSEQRRRVESLPELPVAARDVVVFCDIVLQQTILPLLPTHPARPGTEARRRIHGLLNLVLQRAARPVHCGDAGTFPSGPCGIAVLRAFSALGPVSDESGGVTSSNEPESTQS